MATAPAPPEAELVARLQHRDRSAWEELYRLYEGRLYAFAYRLTGNPYDAADLVQETLVRALPRLDSLDPDELNLSAYLFTTSRNLFLHGIERGKRAGPFEEVPEPREPQPLEDDTELSALLERQQYEVRLANARLAPRQRLALALRELEDRSYAEIGELVGLNENTVAQLISRARQSLRDELRLGQVDPATVPDACRSLQPLLSAHLDGQLREPARSEVLAHVTRCEHCRDALEEMREASRLYRSLVPPVAMTALFERVDRALAATSYWEQRPNRPAPRRLHRTRRFAGIVMGVAIVGLVVGVVAVYPLVDTPEWPQLAARPEPAQPTPQHRAGASTASPATTTAAPGTPAPPPPPPPPPPSARVAKPSGATAAALPTVAITARPPALTSSPRASFSFETGEPGSAFRCRLDGGRPLPCTSPHAYANLSDGGHVFSVQAVAGGRAGRAASFAWTIDSVPRTEKVSPGASNPTRQGTPKRRVTSGRSTPPHPRCLRDLRPRGCVVPS